MTVSSHRNNDVGKCGVWGHEGYMTVSFLGITDVDKLGV